MIGTYPIGPTIGTSFNLTLLSYRKKLEMGLNVDSKAVGDPELLGRLLDESVRDFVARHDDIRSAMAVFRQGVWVIGESRTVADDGTATVTVELALRPLWNMIMFYHRTLSIEIE